MVIRDVHEIEWEKWQPKERAVLCFIRDGKRLMLIHKKRGLGKGKVNAPGGRIEIGETTEMAAVRETQEEIGLTPLELEIRGELLFIFTDGYSLHGTVFFANKYSGTPVETDEGLSFWCDLFINYHTTTMWADDRYGFHLLLMGNISRVLYFR